MQLNLVPNIIILLLLFNDLHYFHYYKMMLLLLLLMPMTSNDRFPEERGVMSNAVRLLRPYSTVKEAV